MREMLDLLRENPKEAFWGFLVLAAFCLGLLFAPVLATLR